MKIMVVSGYFDPIHDGHVEYFEKAKKLGDKLVVILNNDNQAVLKKGKPFMVEGVRKKIVEAIKWVDEVVLSIDTDRSVCKTLELVAKRYPNDEVFFVNGGDRNATNIPEFDVCNKMGIKFVDGAGEKINSSRVYYSK
ncbi:MAG: adenylyltransferase/cytidyltransferase family protein [archaeon]